VITSDIPDIRLYEEKISSNGKSVQKRFIADFVIRKLAKIMPSFSK
jgi:hypothetical protein